MRELKIVRELFHAQVLHVRNINNIINSDNFEVAFNLSSDKEKHNVLKIISELDKDGIKNFIDSRLSNGTPFDQLNIRKLRDIGKHMRISNYHVLNKMSLIEEIKNVTERLKENCERKCFQS